MFAPKLIICIAAAIIALGLWRISQDNLEAMKACQQTHSYDTCAGFVATAAASRASAAACMAA